MTISDHGWPISKPHASKDELPTDDIWAVEAGTAGLPTSVELDCELMASLRAWGRLLPPRVGEESCDLAVFRLNPDGYDAAGQVIYKPYLSRLCPRKAGW